MKKKCFYFSTIAVVCSSIVLLLFNISQAGEFHINGGDKTTATAAVSLHFADPADVKEASASNDGIAWSAVFSGTPPAANPVSWSLDPVPGSKIVFMRIKHADDSITNPPASATIDFYPHTSIASGTRDSGTFPDESYEEYSGRNTYGTSKGLATQSLQGHSLQLRKP